VAAPAQGGGGAGGGLVCTPGAVEACYTGPAGTLGVGSCAAGTATCSADGTVLGPCVGEVLPAAESCSTPDDEDCDGAPGCSGNHLWSKRFGDAGNQWTEGIATDANGNVLVSGAFEGTVDFGGGPLTSAGIWDAFVAKLDPAGDHLWSQRIGEQAYAFITTDAAGNVLVVGYFQGTVDLGGGPLTSAGDWDVFVAKLDAAGNHLWSKRFGDASLQGAESIATDAAGNVLVTGYFEGTVDLGGGPLTSAGDSDIFVAKLDPAGNHLWSKRFGDASLQVGFGGSDAAGNVLVTGYFEGTVDLGGGPLTSAGSYDVFVAKLDPSGNHLWSQRFGDASLQAGFGTIDASGNVLVSGHFEGTVDFGGGPLSSAGGLDAFIAKLDPAGNHLWSKRFGDESHQGGPASPPTPPATRSSSGPYKAP
jgi:hypothetical protein